MDLTALQIFKSVVEQGGVNKAAAKLHRVPSNVTTRIKQLEEQLGTKLFLRVGRRLALSAAGKMLLPFADQLLRLSSEAEAALRNERPRGTLRIGSLESTAGSRLAPLLSKFHRLYPGVVVELVTGTPGALIQRVSNFEIEAAFVSEPFTAPGLNATKVFEEELVLITSRDVPDVGRASQLAGMTLIAFTNGCSYRKRVEEWLGSANVMPERVMEFASYPAMIACVAAGTGFAIVPASVLQTLRAARNVRQHPLPKRFAHNRTHIVWPGDPSPSLQGLLELL